MPDKEVLWVAVGVVVLLVVLQLIAKSKKPIRSAVSGALLGWLALLGVNAAGAFTG